MRGIANEVMELGDEARLADSRFSDYQRELALAIVSARCKTEPGSPIEK
jgi:hypothetical protein